jgi:hypothetical protein
MATTTTMSDRRTTRHSSALGAARSGWHKWSARHWGWFVPFLAVAGLVRGTVRTVKWSAPRIGTASKWAVRHPVRFARWSAQYAKAQFFDGLDAIATVLDRHGKTRPADKIRAFTGRTGMTCGYCGAQLTVATAERHMNAHNGEVIRQNALIKPTAPNVTPIRPRPAPTAPATSVPVRPAPRPAPSAPTVPVAATRPSTAGGTMSATGTSETQQLMRAANSVGEMDPSSAWELDAQLVGMARAALVLTENLGQYVETLDRIKTDPRVTAQAGLAVGQVAELVQTFTQARNLFRTLYAAQFAAAEQGVRQINVQGFFDARRAA